MSNPIILNVGHIFLFIVYLMQLPFWYFYCGYNLWWSMLFDSLFTAGVWVLVDYTGPHTILIWDGELK